MRLANSFALTLFLLGALTIGVAAVGIYMFSASSVEEQASEQLLLNIEDAAYHLETNLSHSIDLIKTISQSDSVRMILAESNAAMEGMKDEELSDYLSSRNRIWQEASVEDPIVQEILSNDTADFLKRFQQMLPQLIGEVFLTNRYGAVTAGTTKLTTFEHAQKYWWQRAYNSGKGRIFLDDRGYDDSVGAVVLGITVPVFQEGRFIGMLKANIRTDVFVSGMNASDTNAFSLYLLRSSGMIVSGGKAAPLTASIGSPTLDLLTEDGQDTAVIIDSKRIIAFTHLRPGGQDVTFGGKESSIDHTRGGNGDPWIVLGTLERTAALQPLRVQQILYLELGLLLVLILAVVSLLISRRQVKPITLLAEMARRIGRGDLSATAEMPVNNELGELGRTLSMMAEDLQKSMTSRESLEQEIIRRKEGEKQYRDLFSKMSEGFALHRMVFDEQGEPVDYIYMSVNPAFERLTGLRADQIIGKSVLEILPELEEVWIREYGRIVRERSSKTFSQYSRILGKFFLVHAFSPSEGTFATLITDISSLKETQRQLEEDKRQLTTVLDTISEAVILTDSEGMIVYMNQEAEDLIGPSASEDPIRLSSICRFLRKDSEGCPISQVLETGITIKSEGPEYIEDRQGNRTEIEYQIQPIIINSLVSGAVIVLYDVTERERMRKQMVLSDRMESLSVLSSGIAHDFNNYLGGIFGYIELALTLIETEDLTGAKEFLTHAFEVYDKSKGLTQQLMTFSKGSKPDRQPHLIQQILEECVSFSLSGSSMTAEVSVQPDLPVCLCDKQLISQSIDNLLINAKQAMADTGTISISITLQRQLHFKFDPKNERADYVKISITDTGSGIPAGLLSRIYDPFFTTKETGHGLGLAVVFSTIQQHQGWVDVTSVEQKGTEFLIYLPLGTTEEMSREAETEREPYRSEGHVLILDDQDFMREIIARMLEQIGYTPLTAETGKQALEIYEKHAASIIFCILDLTLPGELLGKDIARILHKRREDLPCIAASGYAKDPIIANPREYGFAASLPKPFTRKQLEVLLSELRL